MMKFTFQKDIQIATLRSTSKWNKFKIHTLLQNCNQKQPAINAYLGARYSRSADSITDIANEIIKNNTDAAERLEQIFSGYGHKSVGDMADLFLCIENIPMTTAMTLFYQNSVLAGQERSTRYQNFESPEFVKIPLDVCKDSMIRKEYEKIIFKQMKDYRELHKLTKDILKKYFHINEENQNEKGALRSRAFDTARFLLPSALQTNMAILMSARNWSEQIAYMNASDKVVDNELGKLIYTLLAGEESDGQGYVKEAENLIRHTDANCCRRNSTRKILDYIEDSLSKYQEDIYKQGVLGSVRISYNTDAVETLISNYESLLNPLGSAKELTFSEDDQKALGEILWENHNQHNLMGNIGQSGAIKLEGFCDIGSLRDLNRHRSMERYIPLLHDEVDIDQELNRSSSESYALCEYLNIQDKEIKELKKEYTKRLTRTYDMIKEWRRKSKEVMAEEVSKEFTRYLFPLAHLTKYSFCGSIDDIQYTINLRTRNGGHISYRMLTYKWLKELSNMDTIWQPLLRKTVEVNPQSREQFVDRS